MPQKTWIGPAPGTPEYSKAIEGAVFQGGAKFFKAQKPGTDQTTFLTRVGNKWKEVTQKEAQTAPLGTSSQRFADLGPGGYEIDWISAPNVAPSPTHGSGNLLVAPETQQQIEAVSPINPATGQLFSAADLPAIGSAEHLAQVQQAGINQGLDLTPEQAFQASTTGGAGFTPPFQPSVQGLQFPSDAEPLVSPQLTTQPPSPIQTFTGGNQTTTSIVDFLKSVGQPSDFGFRSGLAQKAGITNYQGTAAQNTQLLNMLKGAAPTPTPSGLTPETLAPATGVQIPGAEGINDSTGLSNALVDGANTAISQIMAQLTPPETAADQQKQALLDRMTELVTDQAQAAADQLTAEQSAGLPELRQDFADINAQILEKSAQYKVLQVENQNKPITMNTIIGNDRAIMNAAAADIGLLQAQALGLQGQIETAQNTVNRAIDLKYSSIQSQMDIYQAQLNALQPTLNKQEKQQALAQQLLLDEQQQALKDLKAQESDIQGIMLDYINSGGTSASVMNQISNAPSVTEAIKILGANIPLAPVTGGGGGGVGTVPGLTLTKSQLNTAKGNYFSANPDATELDFDSLTNEQKFSWFKGGPTEVSPIDLVIQFQNDLVDLKDSGLSAKQTINVIKQDGGSLNEQELGIFQNVFSDVLKKEAKSEGFGKLFQGSETEISNFLQSIN